MLVVKTGGKGSIIKQGNTVVNVDVLEIEPVDTTGAGDLYAAGFLYGITNDYDLKKAGEIGSLLASKVIQNIGAKISDENWIKIREEVML